MTNSNLPQVVMIINYLYGLSIIMLNLLVNSIVILLLSKHSAGLLISMDCLLVGEAQLTDASDFGTRKHYKR